MPNPSFENYNKCPESGSEIDYSPAYSSFPTVQSWINPLNTSTPDYYNACAPDPSQSAYSVGVPHNYMGFRSARSGNGYAGIYPYSSSWAFNYSEYIECRLLQPLQAGVKYDVAFYISYAYRTTPDQMRNYVAISRIGAHFSDTLLFHPGYASGIQVLEAPFHIEYSGGYLTDTANWVKISGVYQAKGGEEYMTIGTFNDGKTVNTIQVFPLTANAGPSVQNLAYYFIDDVSVIQQPQCDTIIKKHDTVACRLEPLKMTLLPMAIASSYYWNTGANTAGLQIDKTGKYWRIATHECDMFVDSFTVKAVTGYKTIDKDTTVCTSNGMILAGKKTNTQYLWSTGDTTESIVIYKEGKYRRKTIDGCTELTESFNVLLNVSGIKLELGNDTIICKEEGIVIGKPLSGVQYQWNTGEKSCCIRTSAAGVYTLTVANECFSVSDSVKIETVSCYNCFFVPSAFTPNADGKNDGFSAIPLCPLKNYTISIYDRWGELVFQSVDIHTKWDGRFKGQVMPVGTYYYYIQYSLLANKPVQIKKGDITLIR